MNTKALLLTVAVAFPAASSFAQDGGRPPGAPPGDRGAKRTEQPDGQRPKGDGPRDGQRKRGPQDGDRPPGPMGPPPLLHALDADEDGIISADELKNAPAAIAKLDKNGDKQVTPDEMHPPRPDGPPPKEGQRDGQRGEKKGDGDRPQKKAEGDKPDKKPADWPFAKDKTGKPEGDAPKADGDQPKPEGNRDGQGNEPPQGPPPPLVSALDTDHNGILSEDETSKASESLATLDKNSDGQLGPREYNAPPRPPGPPPEGAPKDGERKAEQ